MRTRADPQRTALRPCVVVLFGPPLPGRTALGQALERRLPDVRRFRVVEGRFPQDRVHTALTEGQLPVVEGDFATASARAAALGAIDACGGAPVFVEWLCNPAEARREVYRRYASLPARYAERWWDRFREDTAIREPVGGEVPPATLVAVAAGGSLLDHVVRVAAALGLPGAAPSLASRPRTVLVVDDDADERLLLAETLEALGCVVHRAEDAERALEVALREPIELVITDQQMPGCTGTELAARLVLQRPDVHVALLTGYAEETIDSALRTAGVDLLLAKPAAGADLVRLLDELAEPETEPEGGDGT